MDGSVYGDDSVFEIHCHSCGIVNLVVRTSFKILYLSVNPSNKQMIQARERVELYIRRK